MIFHCRVFAMKVLILVLMEYTLRVGVELEGQDRKRLNPCFNGIYSQRT